MILKPSDEFVKAESLVERLPATKPYHDTHAVNYKQLLALVEEGFLKENDFIGPDNCGDVESILVVLRDFPYLRLSGRLLDKRDGVDFTCDNIQGVKKKFTLRDQLDFALRFRHADDLIVNDHTLYAWFD